MWRAVSPPDFIQNAFLTHRQDEPQKLARLFPITLYLFPKKGDALPLEARHLYYVVLFLVKSTPAITTSTTPDWIEAIVSKRIERESALSVLPVLSALIGIVTLLKAVL